MVKAQHAEEAKLSLHRGVQISCVFDDGFLLSHSLFYTNAVQFIQLTKVCMVIYLKYLQNVHLCIVKHTFWNKHQDILPFIS